MKQVILLVVAVIGICACEKPENVSSYSKATTGLSKLTEVNTLDGSIAKANAIGPWVRDFTENFSTATFPQWTLTNRKDYNSIYCQYDPSVPKVATVDGLSSLVLTATKTGTNAYKSGHIKSTYNFKPANNTEYRVSSKIKLVATLNGVYKSFASTYGAWPSIWMTDESVWPTNGEIDIMEGYSFGGTTNFTSNLFYGTTVGVDLLRNSLVKTYPASFNSAGWHTYDCYWKNQNNLVTVSTYIDGVLIRSYTNSLNSNLNLNDFGPHNVILNLNVGSSPGINIFDVNKINLLTNTQMWVDYVTIDKRTL